METNCEQNHAWVPCPMHKAFEKDFISGEKRMDRFEDKIDDLIEGQMAQAIAIQALRDTLGNGIQGDLRRTRMGVEALEVQLKEVCTKYDAKFDEHDDMLLKFKWFRDWANGFKDSVIRKVLTITFIGGAVMGLVLLGAYVAGQVIEWCR